MARAGAEQREAELANLYELSRALLGARDQAQVASRAVWSGMAILGVRSGSAFIHSERGTYRPLYTSVDLARPDESVSVPAAAREWMLRENVFALGPAAARTLGPLRDRLIERFDGSVGVAIADSNGLLGFLLFGPRLLPDAADAGESATLDSIGTLTAQALSAHAAREAPAARKAARVTGPSRAPGSLRSAKTARTMEALRSAHPPLRTMVGSGPVLIETCQDLISVARTHFPALLLGESGSGKELAAQAIHQISERAQGPFEIVDCGSLPHELIESELFGHVRGAFTGAHRDRRGAFELAQRGTLFLDEIGEMPLQLQTRLLRVLQEGRFRRVGDERVIETDARLVAATNRNLKAEVAAHRFREDLYYRLNVFMVRIPPLRERVCDVPELVEHFLGAHFHRLGIRDHAVSPEVLEALESYEWPGNVRELANLCAALVVRTRERREIGLDDLDHVWKKQHDGDDPPWNAGAAAMRGRLGPWVLEQVRASDFNLLNAARALRAKHRAGSRVPLAERSALSYYLTGEILRALVEANGDLDAACGALAGAADGSPRVRSRVMKVLDALRAAPSDERALQRRFAKLPAGYEQVLVRAKRLAAER